MIGLVEIQQALAIGYCHSVNENKKLDLELITAMAAEVLAAIQSDKENITSTNTGSPNVRCVVQTTLRLALCGCVSIGAVITSVQAWAK